MQIHFPFSGRKIAKLRGVIVLFSYDSGSVRPRLITQNPHKDLTSQLEA